MKLKSLEELQMQSLGKTYASWWHSVRDSAYDATVYFVVLALGPFLPLFWVVKYIQQQIKNKR